MFHSIIVLSMISASVALICGCGQATDPDVLVQRTKYLLTEEPSGALGVIEVRQKIGGNAQDDQQAAEQNQADDKGKTENSGPSEQGDPHKDTGHEEADDHHCDHATAKPGENFTIVGRIGGVPNPWNEGNAAFMIVDNTSEASASEQHEHAGHNRDAHGQAGHDHEHGDPGHDPETCPFCKQNKDNSKALAIVQFEDEQGKVLGIDARKLFDVSRNQTVVVRGITSFDDLGNLVISASGLYIRE